MKQMVICLMFVMSITSAHAGYLMRTADGHVYKNCTVLKLVMNTVVVRSDKGEVGLELDRLIPADRSKIEPELKRLRLEAEKKAAINAEAAAARKAAAQSTQAIALNPPEDLTTGDGHIYRSVTRIVIDGTGEGVTLNSSSGLERIRFDTLSSDWQTKLQSARERAKTDGANFLWEKRIKDARAAMAANSIKIVTATLCGMHKGGVRAYLTTETKDRKTVKVTTEVLITGLPGHTRSGSWSGTLLSKEVFADRTTDEVFQVWTVPR